jgi:hypothetical protein
MNTSTTYPLLPVIDSEVGAILSKDSVNPETTSQIHKDIFSGGGVGEGCGGNKGSHPVMEFSLQLEEDVSGLDIEIKSYY